MQLPMPKPANIDCSPVVRDGVRLQQGTRFDPTRTFAEIVAAVKADCKVIATVLCVKHRVIAAPKSKRITIKVEFTGQEWREWDDPVRGRTPEGEAYFEPFDAILRSYNSNRKSTYEWIEHEFDGEVKLVKEI